MNVSRAAASTSLLAAMLLASESSLASGFVISNLEGSSSHVQSSVWTGRPLGLNGKRYDFTDLYASKRFEFNVSGLAHFAVNDKAVISLPFSLDAGYDSDLLSTEPSILLGFGITKNWSNHSVSFMSQNILRIGGKVRERPCYDSFDREFHCGTALPWSDIAPFLSRNKANQSFSFRYRYFF